MGQQIGKASLHQQAKPFVNLPVRAMRALWQEFNLYADSWAIDPVFWKHLCESMMENDWNETAANALFGLFDTDKNDLVDGLELISTLGMLSGMTREEKVEFVFACYNLGGRSRLTPHELYLLLKSTSTGLCKLSGIDIPEAALLESVANMALVYTKDGVVDDMSLENLSTYCDVNPVASSWVAFFDDCEGQDLKQSEDGGSGRPPLELKTAASDIDNEEFYFRRRTPVQERANLGAHEGTALPGAAPKGPWVAAAAALAPPKVLPEADGEDEEDPPDEEESSRHPRESNPPQVPLPPPAPPAPDTRLSLEWVYGYSASTSRSSVSYCVSNTAEGVGVVYPAGKVAVVLSQPLDEEGLGVEMEGDRVQSFMQEHTDNITALAVSPCGKLAATGEAGDRPKVIVWNIATKGVRGTLVGFHSRGVAGISWSPCGHFLASVGADRFHTLQIVDISKFQAVFRSRVGRCRPLGITWTTDGGCVVTSGQNIRDGGSPLVFWTKARSNGSFVKKRSIPAGGDLAASTDVQVCVCTAPGGKKDVGLSSSGRRMAPSVVSGTLKGGLCLWRGRNCSKAVSEAHAGPIEALAVGEDRGGIVISGGKDAKVKMWASPELTPLATLDLIGTPSAAALPQVRSVCIAGDGSKVLVGTLGCDIFELAAVEMHPNSGSEEGGDEDAGNESSTVTSGVGRVLNGGRPLACGHCVGQSDAEANAELRDVDVSAQGFVTVGDDGTVREWSNNDKRILRTHAFGSPALSVAYSPDASFIAVGLESGGVSVLKATDEEPSSLSLEKHLQGFKDSAGGVTCLRFSPSGGLLFAGYADGSLCSWGTADRDWEGAASAAKLVPGAISHMDFTIDSGFLMINSSEFHMIVVNSETCARASSEELQSLRGEGEGAEVAAWATSTCTMADGKQATWASMSTLGPSHPEDATTFDPCDRSALNGASTSNDKILTGSDLVKGGETPILLVSDALGRLGLFRYPAPMPDAPIPLEDPAGACAEATSAAPADTNTDKAKNGPVEAAEKPDARMVEAALSDATPRSRVVQAHAGRISAARQIGQGGQVVTLGADDRCIYQWAVDFDEGEESGEDLPDPPACNAPAPKTVADVGDGGDHDDGDGGEGDEQDNSANVAWSGDDEDFLDAAGKPRGRFSNGSQDMSAQLDARYGAETGETSTLSWLAGLSEGDSEDTGNTKPSSVPDEDLELEWIHGYSSQGSRQNLVYNCNGEIVYPAACAGVVMTKCTPPQLHRQRFNLEHTQAITCLAIHPGRRLVATGQEGSFPLVMVWDSTTKPTKTCARLELGGDKTSASQVRFSADGHLLAVACEDTKHTVMIFRWESGVLRCQAQAGAKKVLSLCFSLMADEILAAGHKHFKVWALSGGGLMQGRRGLFGSGSSVQAITCAEAVSNGEDGSSFLLGGSSGCILRIEGRKVSTSTEAHEGALYAMYAYTASEGQGTSLITGGSDGKVKIWDAELELVKEFDIAGRPYLWGAKTCIRSIFLNDHSDGRKLLVGTSCSEIIEISTDDGHDINGGNCLVRGHFREQLWGLGAHPAKALYCTSGDEGLLREWDAKTLTLQREIDLEGWIRCVRYSPNGLLIACGMGGEVNTLSSGELPGKTRRSPREEDGTIKIVSCMEDSFRVVNTLSDAIGGISCIHFSPDGNRMAAASLDGNIYLYSVIENFKLECMSEPGRGSVLRLDFSSDGKWIRAETKPKEDDVVNIFLSAESGDLCQDRKIDGGIKEFATWTCLCGKHTAGIWPADACCLPSDVSSCCRSLEGGLLATADARGDVKLFRYPAKKKFAAFKSFKCHAPGARGACFVGRPGKSQLLVSVGGKDRCVMQWKIIQPDMPSSSLAEASSSCASKTSQTKQSEQDPWVQAELLALKIEPKEGDAKSLECYPQRPGPDTTGSVLSSGPSDPGGASLDLELAHGYNASGQARDNLGFTWTDKLVFPCASVALVYDKEHHSQALFTGHNGRVLSLAVSPCGRFVATGQEGQEGRGACTFVWDPETGHQLCRLPASISRAVRRLAFSPDSSSICGVGADSNNSLCVWTTASGTWEDGARIAVGKGLRSPPLFATWTGAKGCISPQIVTGGQEFVMFWSLWPNLRSRLGRKAPSDDTEAEAEAVEIMAETFLCGVSLGEANASTVVTGTSSGAFFLWENGECSRIVRGAHDSSAVLALTRSQSGGIASGDSAGYVKVWDKDLNVKGCPINISQGGLPCEAVRAVAVNRMESKMAVGTSSGRVLEVSLDSGHSFDLVDGPAVGGPLQMKRYPDGDSPAEGTAVACSPIDRNLYVTGASDGFIRKWSIDGRRLEAKCAVGDPYSRDGKPQHGGSESGKIELRPAVNAIAWAPCGQYLACGLSSGDIVAVSPDDMVALARCSTEKKPKSEVTALVICKGDIVVVGCKDGSTHGMTITSGGKEIHHGWSNSAQLAGGAVLAIDRSIDGQTARFRNAAGVLVHMKASSGLANPTPAPPNESDPTAWASNSCGLGVRTGTSTGTGTGTPGVQGEPRASVWSNSKKLLAWTTSDGYLSLSPSQVAAQEEPQCYGADHVYVGFRPAIAFNVDDSRLISVGGQDGSVFQWIVKE